MVNVNSGKVLVTGANGYIAAWVVKLSLEAGFSVRGTVRSESRAIHLRRLFAKFGENFEVVIVEDITKDGAFDDAVRGVDAIEHIASPSHMRATDPDDVITPAVRGTIGILASAQKHGKSVKRIVITSSCAAVITPSEEPRVFDESDWNELSLQEVTEKGRAASGHMKYCASKVLAERAAWEFYERNKSAVSWDLVVLNPPWVFGPSIHELYTPEDLNESLHIWYLNVVEGVLGNEALVNNGSCYADVRDIALAHLLALQKTGLSGKRIIISAGTWKWQDFVSIAHRLYDHLPAGNTSYDHTNAVHLIRYSLEKERRLLGIKFRTLEETTRDTLKDFKARGWL
ncbi:NAD(P)-binding protein [Trametes coccinea BRFM310]|uniref:NAD(P)-binding protein n=1 Tax=Trametes coccinea (strain BRFM310) TaxID=1353009 RepID=A0A1Y2J348_TRAC3|nr:NAD(P)-binding protein [Trametes coccinea BRFM310]